MLSAMSVTVPDTGQTTWYRSWFPSIRSMYGSDSEEMVDPSFRTIMDLSDLRRQP